MKRYTVKTNAIQLITALLSLLFFYAALSKLTNYNQSLNEMHNQVFPSLMADVFTWLIPSLELFTGLALWFPSSRALGLWLSLALMGAFTVYIFVVMTGVFGRIPCSCGGVLKHMSYRTHAIFNILFIALSIAGLLIHYQKLKINTMLHPNHRKEVTRKLE